MTGMVLGGVRADDQDDVRPVSRSSMGLVIAPEPNDSASPATVEAVAQPRAVVDVVRAHHRAHELLEHVVLFVGALGRSQAAEASPRYLRKLARDELSASSQLGLAEAVGGADQRRLEAVGMETNSNDPNRPLTHRRPRDTGASWSPRALTTRVAAGAEQDAAAGAAVGAHGGDLVLGPQVVPRGERAGRAALHALAARLADGLDDRAPAERLDGARVAAFHEVDGAEMLISSHARTHRPQRMHLRMSMA